MPKFEKGHTPAGRALPQPPEVKTARLQLKALINQLLVDKFGDFQQSMDKLKDKSPNAYCKIYVDMLAYSLPKISTIAFGADDESQTNPATALLKEIANYSNSQKKE